MRCVVSYMDSKKMKCYGWGAALYSRCPLRSSNVVVMMTMIQIPGSDE